MITTGLINYPPSASKLIASFALNPLPGTTSIAHSIADRINGLDTYSWNTIIKGYLEENDYIQAISVYNHVRRKGLKVDSYTLLYVIRVCGFMPMIHLGLQIHCLIHKIGFVLETIIQTSLFTMYALFDDLYSVHQVFDESPERDLVMWNALITIHAQRNNAKKAIDLSRVMIRDAMRPNGVTMVSIISACSSLNALKIGKSVHGYVMKNFIEIDVFVSNSLIDMYSKCGNLSYARDVFRTMDVKNIVSWTSMINGYSDNNFPKEALSLFKQMECENLEFDEITILGIISMCSKLANFELGERIDRYIAIFSVKKRSNTIENALIDMYSKCGNIKKACQIFDSITEKTLFSWSSIIHGLALHGHGVEALLRFSQMERAGLKPDGVVFLSVLSACCHAGLLPEGRKCFNLMVKDYFLEPWMEHYGCMVDLLCRAGQVAEAFEFVQKMPIEPDMAIKRILLGACRDQGNISLANKIVIFLRNLSLITSDDYVMMSNLYANCEEWDSVSEVRIEMREKGLQKLDPGCSYIGMN